MSDRDNHRYDVVVVGASIAGCVAALGFARRGLRVALLERKSSLDEYKELCTHFVQPMALPTLQRLGLTEAIEARGGLRTKAAFWTSAGWIDPPGAYSPDPSTAHAYNIERRVLDPLLRAEVQRYPEAELRLGHRVCDIQQRDHGWNIEVQVRASETSTMVCRLLVAADGRQSSVAHLLGAREQSDENQRSAYFGYFRGLPVPGMQRSLFLLGEDHMGFIYPLAGGITLLSAYVPRRTPDQWKRGLHAEGLVQLFDGFPLDMDLSQARPVSRVLGYVDYPNLSRPPVVSGVPLVGDAALSLDPMSGVGCGFAMVSAEMLVDATVPALTSGSDLQAALAAYEQAFRSRFLPHARGIAADSIIGKSPDMVHQTFRRVMSSPKLQDDFIALTGRLISPQRFQQAYVRAAARS